MKPEIIQSFRRGIMTTALLARDVLRHSSRITPSTSIWDEAEQIRFNALISDHLSNPFDEERVVIRDSLKRFKVESVLDLGSGPSTELASYKLDDELNDVMYVGLDGSERMIQLASERYPGVRLVKGTVNKTPFDERSFDAVVIKHVLEHQPNGYEQTIVESIRVAKKCVVIDFFHAPMKFGVPDINIKDLKGHANNWYNRRKFEGFLDSLPIASWERTSCEGNAGQVAVVYSLALQSV